MLRRKVSIRLFLSILVCLASVLGASGPFANMLERTGWDGRYIKYKDCGAYFVGFDMQEIASDTKIDYEDELELLSEYDINSIRIWLYTSWFGTDGPGLDILYPWRVVEVGKKLLPAHPVREEGSWRQPVDDSSRRSVGGPPGIARPARRWPRSSRRDSGAPPRSSSCRSKACE